MFDNSLSLYLQDRKVMSMCYYQLLGRLCEFTYKYASLSDCKIPNCTLTSKIFFYLFMPSTPNLLHLPHPTLAQPFRYLLLFLLNLLQSSLKLIPDCLLHLPCSCSSSFRITLTPALSLIWSWSYFYYIVLIRESQKLVI